MAPSPPTLTHARALLRRHDSVGVVHRRGYHWVQREFKPCLRRLSATGRSRDAKLAARGFYVLGDVHDLNGAPRAAIRAYQRCIRLRPKHAEAWREIGGMYDNVGQFKQARRALLRAAQLAPKDEFVSGDLERVEWALFHPYPALYTEGNIYWECSEAIASQRYQRALGLVARKRSCKARQWRAQVFGARGNAEGVLSEWAAIARTARSVELQHGDWHHTFQGPAGDRAALWQLMLWQVRTKLGGGVFNYPPTLWELDLAASRRFELYCRFHLARCQSDLPALLSIASKYPAWREPGELVLRLAGDT